MSVVLFVSDTISAGNPEKVLKEMSAGSRPLADLVVTYNSGNPNFTGRTSLTVKGDGNAVLEWEQKGKKGTYKNVITEKGIKTILEVLLKDKIWMSKPPKKPYAPDSTEAEITVSTKQKDLNIKAVDLETNLRQNENLRTTYRLFRVLMKEMSKGKVQY